jgi:glycine/D-amino acid oxidase-like deaminating enzyme
MKTIIVGGGVMGLSLAWALDGAGQEVELFEQGPLPNPLASSMDEHRLIRHPYGDHKGYARMIDQAYTAWEAMWRDLGQRLYAPTGTLALTGNGADWAERSASNLAAIGRPMTELSTGELPRRFPMIDTRGVERAFWIATGGELFAQDIVTALVRHLERSRRVTLHALTPVRAVDPERGQVVTDGGARHDADTVVVSAGAWVTRLLPGLAARLTPSRQVVIYFGLPDDARAAWAKGPMIIDKTGDVGLYLVPPAEGRGMKVGDHEFSRRGDPAGERDATAAEMAPLLGRCRSLLRGFDDWQIDHLKVCFYTVTDDERFIVEKLGGKGWVMSPCSGHGFKFAALMGRELARTIVDERDEATHARWAAGLADEPST